MKKLQTIRLLFTFSFTGSVIATVLGLLLGDTLVTMLGVLIGLFILSALMIYLLAITVRNDKPTNAGAETTTRFVELLAYMFFLQ